MLTLGAGPLTLSFQMRLRLPSSILFRCHSDITPEVFSLRINKCSPEYLSIKSSKPICFIKNLSRLKKKFQVIQKVFNIRIHNSYCISIRNHFINLNNLWQKSYVSQFKNNFLSDPKSYFSFVNTKRKFTYFPPSLTEGIAYLFASFFKSTYSIHYN